MRQLFALVPYMTRRPLLLWGGLACLALTAVFTSLIPKAVGGAVRVVEEAASVRGPGGAIVIEWPRLWSAIGLLLLFSTLAGLFRFGMRKMIIDVSRLAERDFRDGLFRHLLSLSPSFYDRTMTGDVVTRLSSDIDALRTVMGPGLMYLAQTVITVPLILVLMMLIDVPLSLVALAPLVIVPFLVLAFSNELHRRSREVQDQMSTLSNMVQETLAGQRVVKVFNQEAAEEAKFGEINEEYVRRGLRFARLFAGFFPLLHGVFAAGLMITVWVGGVRLMSGAIDFGDLSSVLLWIFELYWPLISLGWVMSLFQRGAASMERIREFQREVSDVADREPAPAPLPARLRGEIEFRQLTFTYPGASTPALTDITLHIPAGRTLGIVGLTGAGKSTLAALVARLYRVPPGTLFIDGVDINALPLAWLRRHIGFVAQETFLFSESIEDNIRFGRPEAPRSEVEIAAELSQLDDQIAGFPRQYETMLGERGINLSGGQRQRAAIARATLLSPPILILDDALSSVDTDTEDRILRGLRGVMRERTTLIIAHRISTVMHADEIIVLDGGRVAERGTHAQLILREGLYAQLHEKQLLEAQLEAVD